ncbi:anti-sigma factor domain-containing protein [Streptomyces sp. Wb2n-11]|uniref:anti-sigma factor n=1 Tax=Streptomyces sp. Wb2n-11 TaxID=1030533 RepID=UPI000A8C9F23|nr:anti-sigma factor [Streptomyces sp. Wb2n-11]
MSEEHIHLSTGAYALNAVPDEERKSIERHLRQCSPCDQEIRELTATAARLGTDVTVTALPGMKDQVMARIQAVPQLSQLPPQAAAVDAPHQVVSARTARTGNMSRLVLAACVVAAAAFGGTAAWQYQEARQAEQRAVQASQRSADMARVLAASDARRAAGSIKGGARATVIVSRSQDSAVFLASGLPDLADGRTYQLWFADNGTMRPAGLLRHDGGLVMEGKVGKATGMGVTVEPAGGSPQPTTTPLALMTLPA